MLEPYEYPKAHKGNYLHAPVAVIYANDKENREVKLPLGIRFNVPKRITSDGWKYYEENGKDLKHRVYTPKSPHYVWQFAKLHTAHADT